MSQPETPTLPSPSSTSGNGRLYTDTLELIRTYEWSSAADLRASLSKGDETRKQVLQSAEASEVKADRKRSEAKALTEQMRSLLQSDEEEDLQQCMGLQTRKDSLLDEARQLDAKTEKFRVYAAKLTGDADALRRRAEMPLDFQTRLTASLSEFEESKQRAVAVVDAKAKIDAIAKHKAFSELLSKLRQLPIFQVAAEDALHADLASLRQKLKDRDATIAQLRTSLRDEKARSVAQQTAADKQLKDRDATIAQLRTSLRENVSVKDHRDHFIKSGLADEEGRTPAYWAAQNGDVAKLKDLIAEDAELEVVSNTAITTDAGPGCPLDRAAYNGHTECVQLLIDAGVDVNRVRDDGTTPTFVAAYNGHTDALRLLIQTKAQINKAREDGVTPTYIAAQQGQTATLRLLIQAKAQIDKANVNGCTPTYIAAQQGQTDALRLLIQGKADVNLSSPQYGSPINRAKQKGHTDIVTMLQRAGARE